MIGQPVYESNTTDNNLYLPIDLTNQAPGIYFISIQTETGRAVKRILVSE